MISKDKFVAARKASGLSLESAAEKAEMSKQGYVNREKPILKDAVSDIFLP